MNSPPAIDQPRWLHDPVFTMRDVCALLNANHDTVTSWLQISKAMGLLIPAKQRHRRLFSGHQVLVIAMLVALARAGLPISETAIRRAIAVTHDAEGKPVLPADDKVAMFTDPKQGESIAKIYIDLSRGWRGLEPKLAEIFDRAQA